MIFVWTFADLIQNFFTHKDYLPSAEQIPGTLFTPLHLVFSLICVAVVLYFGIRIGKKGETAFRKVFGILWGLMVVLEITKILWETVTGQTVSFEWAGILPLYPCSIYMYAMPFALWGKGELRRGACGYVCTLGLLGGLINFVYPANILGNYSCISFAGFHTFFYHGTMVMCALSMLVSGYHSYTGITKWYQLLPSVPFLGVSVLANMVNFSPIRADYMFFKLESFIFAPLGAALPEAASVAVVYLAYMLIQGLPYLPSYLAFQRAKQ